MNDTESRIAKGRNGCKVVSKYDVKLLLRFATKELGSYRLIYKNGHYRQQFISILILEIVAGILSIFAGLRTYSLYSIIAIIISLILIAISFMLRNNLRQQTESEKFDLQSVRLDKLRVYFLKKKYNHFQLEQVCKLLKLKLRHLEKNAIYVLIIAGSLFLSIWSAYVQQVINKNPDAEFTEIVLFLILRIVTLLLFFAIFTPCLNLLRELYFSGFSQMYLIENLVYLTMHIIHEKQFHKVEYKVNCKRKRHRKYQGRRCRHERK